MDGVCRVYDHFPGRWTAFRPRRAQLLGIWTAFRLRKAQFPGILPIAGYMAICQVDDLGFGYQQPPSPGIWSAPMGMATSLHIRQVYGRLVASCGHKAPPKCPKKVPKRCQKRPQNAHFCEFCTCGGHVVREAHLRWAFLLECSPAAGLRPAWAVPWTLTS